MNPKDVECLINALERIADAMEKFVDEGITIFEHQGGDEQQN